MRRLADQGRNHIPRRCFLQRLVAGTGVLAGANQLRIMAQAQPAYRGPRVIIIRFGGGARRRESIEPEHTFSPFLCHRLLPQGVLFKNMLIDSFQPPKGVDTSHGQGTLYLLTGRYVKYRDVEGQFLGQRFEAPVPTIFEYLRKSFSVPDHETLIINGEDRTAEEFYNFSNHHLFGVNYRSQTLSLFRYKVFLLRRQLEAGRWSGAELEQKRQELARMESIDYRAAGTPESRQITDFWRRWREYYGESGLVNPRGDRLLTELAVRALRQLRPKLMMVNYNDCDYVHWGYLSHYTRGISIMDSGIRRIVEAIEGDEEYRDNTVVVVVPDCGRDNNPFAPVPCQHHFGSRSAHEIFCFLMGPGIARGQIVDQAVDQTQVAPTVGVLMGVETPLAEAPPLEEAFL